jgi:hypothetical protein
VRMGRSSALVRSRGRRRVGAAAAVTFRRWAGGRIGVVHRAGGRLFGCIVVAVAVAVAVVVVVVAAVRVGDLGGGTQGEILGCRDSGRRREGLGR